MKQIVTRGLTAALVSAVAVVSAPTGAGASPTTSAAPGGRTSQEGAATATRSEETGSPVARAVRAAQALVGDRPGLVRRSTDDAFRRQQVISSDGLQYVPYERTWRGLPVVGGDLVVVTDDQGNVLDTSVAQTSAVALGSTTPRVTRAAASAKALRRLDAGATREAAPELVVAQQRTSHLAWSTTVVGTRAGEPSRLTVLVDAASGRVLDTTEHVVEGTGSSAYAGTVSIPTSGSGTSFSMTDSAATTLRCQDATGNTTFTGTDDAWGNGDATNRETGCVDAFYAAEQERQMLSTWLGRSGMNGSGGWVPIRVGLDDVNAYYDGTQVQVGHSQTGGRWIGSIDVVAHEFGHGVDDKTPGGISGGGTQEFVADTFGAATEAFANNPSDPRDYTVGEEVDLVGNGPIRYMYNPSLAGDANCWSTSTATSEVHSAAGPGNHFFYLLAEGSNPTNGQPASSTCNGSTVTGLGIQKAMKIMYNAMLLKTTSSSYQKYRTWTLTAAKNLYPGSCAEFEAVKAAWNGVNLPAQSGDPTCTTSGGGTGGATGCTGQKLLNPGFESGAARRGPPRPA